LVFCLQSHDQLGCDLYLKSSVGKIGFLGAKWTAFLASHTLLGEGGLFAERV